MDEHFMKFLLLFSLFVETTIVCCEPNKSQQPNYEAYGNLFRKPDVAVINQENASKKIQGLGIKLVTKFVDKYVKGVEKEVSIKGRVSDDKVRGRVKQGQVTGKREHNIQLIITKEYNRGKERKDKHPIIWDRDYLNDEKAGATGRVKINNSEEYVTSGEGKKTYVTMRNEENYKKEEIGMKPQSKTTVVEEYIKGRIERKRQIVLWDSNISNKEKTGEGKEETVGNYDKCAGGKKQISKHEQTDHNKDKEVAEQVASNKLLDYKESKVLKEKKTSNQNQICNEDLNQDQQTNLDCNRTYLRKGSSKYQNCSVLSSELLSQPYRDMNQIRDPDLSVQSPLHRKLLSSNERTSTTGVLTDGTVAGFFNLNPVQIVNLKKVYTNIYTQKNSHKSLYQQFFSQLFQLLKEQGYWLLCIVSESDTTLDTSMYLSNKQLFPILRITLDSVTQVKLPSSSIIILIMQSPKKITLALSILRKQFSTNFILIFSDVPISRNQIPEDITQWFDIYIFLPGTYRNDKSVRTFVIYEICGYCEDGRHTIHIVNEWKEKTFKKTGFSKTFLLQRSFKGNFYGKAITGLASYATIAPMLSYKVLPNGQEEFGGTINTVLYEAGKHFNFTPKHIFPAYAGGIQNGSWTGGLGDILEGRADTGSPPGLTYEISQNFAYTHRLDTENIIFVSLKPSLLPPWMQLAAPFSRHVWECVAASIILTTFAWHVIQTAHNYMSNSVNGLGRLRRLFVIDSFFTIWTIICLESWNLNHPQRSTIVLMGTWLFCSYYIITVYQSTLTSHLLTPVFAEKPVDSIEDIIELNKKWMAAPGLEIESYSFFTENKALNDLNIPSPPMEKTFETFQELDHSTAVMWTNVLAESNAIAFIGDDGTTKLHISTSTYYYIPIFWVFRKDAEYFEAFNLFFLRIFEHGIYKKLMEDELLIVKLENLHVIWSKSAEATDGELITIEHILGGMILIGAGVAISFIAFIGEIVIFKKQKQRTPVTKMYG